LTPPEPIITLPKEIGGYSIRNMIQTVFKDDTSSNQLPIIVPKPLPILHYDNLMLPFKEIFITPRNFDFGSNIRGHLRLENPHARFKFLTSLNQRRQLLFLFQKEHTSARSKDLSFRFKLELDSHQEPPSFVNTNTMYYKWKLEDPEGVIG
jgi:hypothetical protein